MSDLVKGYTFIDGTSYANAANLHALVENATIAPAAITGKSDIGTIASADRFLVHDDSASALKSVSYSSLQAAIASGVVLSQLKKSVTQAAHGFAVGDVVRQNYGTTTWEKAIAVHEYATFNGSSGVNTTTNIITTDSAHGLVDSEPVWLTAPSGDPPTPLVAGQLYYAKSITSTTLELYSDRSLSTIVDITAVASGAGHRIYHKLDHAMAIGVVSSVSGDDFDVVTSGEITGLSGLTAGTVYCASTSSAGALVSLPNLTVAGSYACPVLISTSTTTGVVIPFATRRLGPYEVHQNNIAPNSVGRDQLSSDVRVRVDQSGGGERQMVLAGSLDANGLADFLTSSGLVVTASASSGDPLVVTFANGFDATNGYNYNHHLTSNLTKTLSASTENFLFLSRSAAGVVTLDAATTSPEYGQVRSQYRKTRTCHPIWSSSSSVDSHVVSSSLDAAGQDAYKAFNNSPSSYWQSGGSAVGAWIRMQFPYPKVVNKIAMYVQASASANGASNMVVQGSNDGSSWTSVSGTLSPASWSGANAYQTFEFANTTAYTYWRVLFNAVTGGGSTAARVYELGFFEAIEYFYEIPTGTMWRYSGGSWSQVNAVFVGEARAGASSLDRLVTYSIRNQFITPSTFVYTSNQVVTFTHNLGHHAYTIDAYARTSDSSPWTRVVAITGASNRIGGSTVHGSGDCSPYETRCTGAFQLAEDNLLSETYHYLASINETSATKGQVYFVVKRHF